MSLCWVRLVPHMMEGGGFAVSTVFCILLAHYAAVFPHEYAHSFMAFALGIKSQPLAIHFRTNSLANIFLSSDDNSCHRIGAAWRNKRSSSLSVSAWLTQPIAKRSMRRRLSPNIS